MIFIYVLGTKTKGKYDHRRRIYTEEKAKVVATVWGTEHIQFLASYFAPG